MAQHGDADVLGMTLTEQFAELAKGAGHQRAIRINEAERAVIAAAMTYAIGPRSDTVGALRALVDAARDLARVSQSMTGRGGTREGG